MAAVVRTLRLKIRQQAYPWLNAAAVEVNQVWNWAAEYTRSRLLNGVKAPSGFDLNRASAGASKKFEFIGADTIQLINQQYASKRRVAGKIKLRWRVSNGSRRSLGWIPFKATALKPSGRHFRYLGKVIRVFGASRMLPVWKQGVFAQDSVGDWWLCLPVEVTVTQGVAPKEAVGIDLGLRAVATTSDGDELSAGRFFRDIEHKIAQAQRRGHKKQAKRLHRRAANRRRDALHKFSRKIVNEYQTIVIGDVSSQKLAKTRMAKSALDSGWGMLKAQLQYKGQQAGRSVEVVNERFTTRACSGCGALTGPAGRTGLVVREWACSECGAEHQRDVNAARNILALRCQRPSAGTRVNP